MAPPPSGQMRPSRYLFTLAAIFIVLYGVVLGFGSGSLSDRLKPSLGLDLVGGTTLTLIAQTTDGKPPTKESLELAKDIIEKRVNEFGVSEAEVVTEGDRNIVVSVPGENNDAIRQVGTPAQMRFRKVLDTTSDLPGTPTPSATPSASASPGASSSPTAAATTPPATTPPATSAPASPSASASAGATPSGTPTPAVNQEDILRKLDSAAAVAAQLQAPPDPTTDAATVAQLENFRKLTPAEIAILPPQIQFNVPQITCDALLKRPVASIADPTKQAVACDAVDQKNTKLLLDVAKVVGTDLSAAGAALNSPGSDWKVDLTFSSEGSEKWTALTREAFNNEGSACLKPVPSDKDPNKQVCQVAVVLDNEVISAPRIETILSTQSQIEGSFTKASAQLLASQLKYGALPLTFSQGEVSGITATLGADYLRAGLLAAGIGMLLVIVYAFFYYRLLGTVIFGSLILSGLLTYGMLVLLGRTAGLSLSLAGIAGFIVSLGVAADSFVIYFERLKDEIREGRSPRSGIQRAWHRARRTIITANAVTILAAIILFFFGVGSVKGFAFALGLATILDLVIVFLFRHPIMTMLARMPAFLSPRVSGLGRVLHHAREDAPAPARKRAKEA